MAGLKVNFIKMKYTVVDGVATNLEIDGMVIEICNKCKYLSVKICKEGTSKREIKYRINQIKQAIRKLNSILWTNKITKHQIH